MTTQPASAHPRRWLGEPTQGPAVARPDSDSAVHAIEDVLIGVAIAAFALDDHVGRDCLRDVVRLLLEARRKGRAEELLAAAHAEAASLPEWVCPRCHERNPGTFEICWCCSELRPQAAEPLSAQSDTFLAVEATLRLPVSRRPDESRSVGQAKRRPTTTWLRRRGHV